MQISFWKILFREMVAPVSSSFLCSHNNKSVVKRGVDFIVRNVSSGMKKWKSWFVHIWMRSRRIDTNQSVLHEKKLMFLQKKRCKRYQILKPQIFIAKQDCFSEEACICYKQTRRIYTEIESFKECVWFTCLSLIAVSSFLLK